MKFVRIFDSQSNLNFVGYFKLAGIINILLIISVIIGILTLGMPWSIDFLGGAELQVKFEKSVTANEIREVLSDIGFGKNQVQQFGTVENNEMLIRIESIAVINEENLPQISSFIENAFPKNAATDTPKIVFDKKSGSQLAVLLAEPASAADADPFAKKHDLDEQLKKLASLIEEKSGLELRKSQASHDANADIEGAVTADEPQNGVVRYTVHFAGVTGKIQKQLESKFGKIEIRRVDFVDSLVSRQLRTDGLLAVIYAVLAIVIYIALRFDIFFSPGAVFSLVTDTMGALFIFVFFRLEFDTPSIAALLTIIGYSVNNTVVIYDRIRETLPQNAKKNLSYEEIKTHVNKAINDTLSRTINTTITTLFASVAIWIFTTGSIQTFAIVLSVGIVIGAFSSVFVAPSAFLLAKKYFHSSEQDEATLTPSDRPSREERAKGIV